MTERSGALQEDPLYMSYAQIISKSCGEEEEEGEEEGSSGGEEEGGASIHVSSKKLFFIAISLSVYLFNFTYLLFGLFKSCTYF